MARAAAAPKRTRTKVEDKGPDSTPLHDFATGDLTAVFKGTRNVTTTYGEKEIHDFELENGDAVSVFGRSMLNRLLAEVEAGTLVEVVETGKKIKTKNGGALKEYEVYTLA